MALEIPEGTEKNPNLKLAQWKFCLENNFEGEDLTNMYNQAELVKILLDEIKKNNMAPFYDTLCASLQTKPDVLKMIKLNEKEVDQMREINQAKILEMDRAIDDAEKNLSEMEVRESCLKKSEFLSIIGDKEGALTAFRKTYEKTVSLGQRLDIVFHLIRIGLFYMDHELIRTNIDKAKTLIDEGGDWDRRNRLKIYHGTYYMAIRDFKNAADLFLETISTFTSVELMDYIEFVKYTVIVAMIALPRKGIQEQIIKGAEIQEVLHGQPLLREFLMSLYECRYDVFFTQLAAVETKLKQDRLLTNHYHFYVREMRIKAYGQLLESYSSLTLSYMAKSFGVSEDFIDMELHRFIAAGRLHCKIDKVEGQVETNRPDNKNWQYQNTIKQGDILLNRIQKLSRVINI